jgi:hypothetical protein
MEKKPSLKHLRDAVHVKCVKLTGKMVDSLKREQLEEILSSGGKCPEKSDTCKTSEILNPASGRCVKKDSKLGKKIQKEQESGGHEESKQRSPSSKKNKSPGKKSATCKSNEILNPSSGRCVKKDGKIGKKLQREQQGGYQESKQRSPSSKRSKSPGKKRSFKTKRCFAHEILNPVTNRCLNKNKPAGQKIWEEKRRQGYDDSKDSPFLIRVLGGIRPVRQLTMEIQNKSVKFRDISDDIMKNFNVGNNYEIWYTDLKNLFRTIPNAKNSDIVIWDIATHNAFFNISDVYSRSPPRQQRKSPPRQQYRSPPRQQYRSPPRQQRKSPPRRQGPKSSYVCQAELCKTFGLQKGDNVKNTNYLKWAAKGGHPDKGGDQEIFKSVNNCWNEILEKREYKC